MVFQLGQLSNYPDGVFADVVEFLKSKGFKVETVGSPETCEIAHNIGRQYYEECSVTIDSLEELSRFSDVCSTIKNDMNSTETYIIFESKSIIIADDYTD